MMVSQKVEKPVIATPDLIPGSKPHPGKWLIIWGLLRRFTPRNDSLGSFFEFINDQLIINFMG